MRAYKVVTLVASLRGAVCIPTEPSQQPLGDAALSSYLKVQDELRKVEIIPTVIDDFLPSLTLSVAWKKADADLGNTIKPKHLQNQPEVSLYDDANPEGPSSPSSSGLSHVITLTDPDAPSRDDPKWSEICHWIVANVSISQRRAFSILPFPASLSIFSTDGHHHHGTGTFPDDVIEYKPPGPPKKTGKHRYVFLVFAPRNGTTEPLHLSKPKDRQHWGTGEEGGGVRDWARENELVPVAANFVYSQHKKQ